MCFRKKEKVFFGCGGKKRGEKKGKRKRIFLGDWNWGPNLVPPPLMVLVVIVGADGGEEIHGVPGEAVPAVVGAGLGGGEGREDHAFPQRHAGAHDGDDEGADAEEEALDGLVVDAAPAVGHVELVVTGVEFS